MHARYIEARGAAFFSVSVATAAKTEVDMQRARNDCEEHHSVCSSAAAAGSLGQAGPR